MVVAWLFVLYQGNADLSFSLMWASGLVSAGLVIFGIIINSAKPIGLVNRIGLLIGDASYAIYLTHAAVISGMLGFWSKFQPKANMTVVTIVIFLACVLLGIAFHLWLEKPLVNLVKGWMKPRAKSAPQVHTGDLPTTIK